MGLQDGVSAAIAGFYDAAAGIIPWEQALDRVLALSGFDGAALWTLQRLSEVTGGRAIWHRLDTAGKLDYVNHYVTIDPNVPILCDPIKNRINYDYLALTEAGIDRHEYYAWYQRESGMRYHVGGVVRPGLPFFASVTLHRPRQRGHATETEIKLFGLLFDHVERALEIEYRLHLGRGVTASLAGISTVSAGCVLLDHSGQIVFINDAAQALAGDALTFASGGLAARRGKDDQALRALIAVCRATASGTGASAGGALRLPRTGGGHDLVVTVAPLPAREGDLGHLGPAVCVLIADPDQERTANSRLLRQLYGLSPAEAGLACKLGEGETLREAAGARGIAVSTARSYLDQIFYKTGTRRQTDLVRLLLALPAAESAGSHR